MAPPRTMALPEQSELEMLFRYNAETGQLRWRKRPRSMFSSDGACDSWNVRFAGTPALTSLNHGYRRGLLFRRSVYAHQIIWKIMTGTDAPELDHIDGNKLNNSWKNLRAALAGENQRNCKQRADNKSGQVGVVSRGERWIAQIGQNGTTKHIGIYETKEAAIKARIKAEKEYGFHKNHGRKNRKNPAA